MMASISNPTTKLISASGAGTLSALAIVHLGLAGLLIGAVVVITVAALSAGDPYPLLMQIHAWRQRRWLLQHTASRLVI